MLVMVSLLVLFIQSAREMTAKLANTQYTNLKISRNSKAHIRIDDKVERRVRRRAPPTGRGIGEGGLFRKMRAGGAGQGETCGRCGVKRGSKIL
jgi:hypothetical protein